MTPKEIIKMAAACRKAGVKHFKCADYEFTLDDAPQAKPHGNSKVKDFTDTKIESDGLSPSELMFWSSGVADEVVQKE